MNDKREFTFSAATDALVVPDRTVFFECDGLSRLKRARTVGGQSYPAWEMTWDYTAPGNRTAQTPVIGNAPASN